MKIFLNILRLLHFFIKPYSTNTNSISNRPVINNQICEDTQLFYDVFSNRYFEAELSVVRKAESALNKKLLNYGYASVNDFYDLLGIKGVGHGNDVGWSFKYDSEKIVFSRVSFINEFVDMDDGLQCYIIEFENQPTADFKQMFVAR